MRWAWLIRWGSYSSLVEGEAEAERKGFLLGRSFQEEAMGARWGGRKKVYKKETFPGRGWKFFHFFPGSLQLASKWEALEMSL